MIIHLQLHFVIVSIIIDKGDSILYPSLTGGIVVLVVVSNATSERDSRNVPLGGQANNGGDFQARCLEEEEDAW